MIRRLRCSLRLLTMLALHARQQNGWDDGDERERHAPGERVTERGRHEMLLTRHPLAEATLVEIVDDVFLPLIRAKASAPPQERSAS